MYDNEHLILLAFGAIAGTMCLVLLFFGLVGLTDKRRALRRFVPVDAVVLSKQAVEGTLFQEEGPTYKPAIHYEYQYDGTSHTSSNVWSGGSEYFLGQAEVEKLLKRFPVGKTVAAYCDPDNPSQSFLLRQHPSVGECVPALLGGVGLLILFSAAASFGIVVELIGVILLLITVAGCGMWLASK